MHFTDRIITKKERKKKYTEKKIFKNFPKTAKQFKAQNKISTEIYNTTLKYFQYVKDHHSKQDKNIFQLDNFEIINNVYILLNFI